MAQLPVIELITESSLTFHMPPTHTPRNWEVKHTYTAFMDRPLEKAA